MFNKEVGSHHWVLPPELGLEQGEEAGREELPGRDQPPPSDSMGRGQVRGIAGMPRSTAQSSPARDLPGKPRPAAPSPPCTEDLDASDGCAKASPSPACWVACS